MTPERGVDAVLAGRIRRRESGAMRDLFARYGAPVYSLIVRIVRDPAIAGDLTVETFLRIWNRIQAFDPGRGALLPWLLGAARERAVDFERSIDGRLISGPTDAADLANPALYRDVEVPAVPEWSAKERGVVEAACFEGLTQSQIAERFGEPLTAVRAWARSALGGNPERTAVILYLAGALDDPERSEVRAQVAAAGGVDSSEVQEAAAFLAELGRKVPLLPVPPSLRRRVVRSAGGAGRTKWVVGAIVVLAFGGLVAALASERSRAGHTRRSFLQTVDALNLRTRQVARAHAWIELMNDPETALRVFDPSTADEPRVRIFAHRDQGLLVLMSSLPPSRPGERYHLWVTRRNGAPLPAGSFVAGPDRTAIHFSPGPLDLNGARAFEVTVEEARDARSPTPPPLISIPAEGRAQ